LKIKMNKLIKDPKLSSVKIRGLFQNVANGYKESLDRYRFNLSKLNKLEVRKQYQVEITNRFAALETLNEDEDVNRI